MGIGQDCKMGIGPARVLDEMGIGPDGYWTIWALEEMSIGPNGYWTIWALN